MSVEGITTPDYGCLRVREPTPVEETTGSAGLAVAVDRIADTGFACGVRLPVAASTD